MDIEDNGASILSSVLNLLNNVVGAGLFSLPWCLKESTVVTGSTLVTFMCFMNITSFMLLADSCDLTKKYSYLELGRTAFGEFFGKVAQITTICYASGSLISYAVLAGDCLAGKDTGILSLFFDSDSFMGNGSLTSRAISTFGISIVFFLPLSLMRKIDSLKYASILAFAATMFAGFLVTYEFVDNPPNSRADDNNDAALSPTVVWTGFPIGIFHCWKHAQHHIPVYLFHFFRVLALTHTLFFRIVCIL
jgi:amino acid permease